MKKSRLLGAVCASVFSLISIPSHAELVDNGGGLIYDTVLDITWSQPDALRRWSGRPCYVESCDDVNTWAAGLMLGGVRGWRLPYISVAAGAGPYDGVVVDCRYKSEATCQDNELGYMFYHNLSGTYGQSIRTSDDPDLALFPTLQPDPYNSTWSGTAAQSCGWWFRFYEGGYGAACLFAGYSWAVHAGNVVPLIDNGYTTIDPTSGLEWLDLTYTQGVSAQDVLAGFGGYIDSGWTFATVEQVCGLFGALGDDTTNCTTGAVAMPMHPTKSETLVNLLGNTAAIGRGAYGMFNNINSFPDNFGIGCIDDTATSCTLGTSSWLTLIEWKSGYKTVGSFLVREFIEPPPTTLIDNGDTTIDTASGLEWLDLPFTQGVSAQDVLNNAFGNFIRVGWTFATVEQVCDLFGALGDDTTNCTTGAVAMPMNPAKSETLVNLLGNTAASGRGAYGMFNNIDSFPDNFGLGCINDTATSCTLGGASSWLTQIEWAAAIRRSGASS